MAYMIPQNPPPPGPGCKAERALWHALEQSLDNNWFVYSRLKYINDTSSRCAEGEADFVLLHRERGMLVVECKGFGVRREGNGTWSRRTENGTWQPMKESPNEQAERTKWQLVELIQSRIKKALPGMDRFPLVHGHACCFPLSSAGSINLPMDTPRTLLFDADDLERIENRVTEALALFAAKAGQSAPGLDARSFKRFRKQVLHPTLELVPTLGATIRAEASELVQLTREQYRVMEGLFLNKRLGVIGGAGTGKTMMALEATRRFAAAGESVLLLCFNRPLAEHLRQCASDNVDHNGALFRVTNFHALCVGAHYRVHNKKPDIPEEKTAQEVFWRDDSPLLLYEGLEAGVVDRFDAIVIDEGQDFAPAWWEVIDDLLIDKEKGRLVVFYDPHQTIFGRECHVPELPTRFPLRTNLRNTKQIGALVKRLGGLDLDTHPRVPNGTDPVIHPQGSSTKTLRKLEELISRLTGKESLLPDQIAILTPRTKKHSTLAETETLGGQPLSGNPQKRDRHILHTTIGSFKGLESDVVILLDIAADEPRSDRNARYVACSRARHLLHVFTKDPSWD